MVFGSLQFFHKNRFGDEVTDVSVRVTMKGDCSYFDDDDIIGALFDTLDFDDEAELDF